jgi:hypothetical protein
MRKIYLSILILLLLASPVLAEQVTANFKVPFNPATRETALPKAKDGQPIPIDWVALTKEKGDSILIQVRAEKAVIDGMKADLRNTWLEDKVATAPVDVKPIDPKAPVEEVKPDGVIAAAKIYPATAQAVATKMSPLADVLKQDWTTSDKAILSLVKLHGGAEAGYKMGLGEELAAKADPLPVKTDPVVIKK